MQTLKWIQENYSKNKVHGVQNLSSLPPATIRNSRWQNFKERPNWYTNNGYIADKAKRQVSEWVSLWHLSNYRVAQLLISSEAKKLPYKYKDMVGI